jgi:hypothetical protein
MVSPGDRPRRLEKLEGKDLGDEFLFYDAEGETVHVLNGTAREVYLLCDGNRTVGDLVEAMLARYEVEESTVHKDIDEILTQLVDLGLLTLA